jgi:hypothetical protein
VTELWGTLGASPGGHSAQTSDLGYDLTAIVRSAIRGTCPRRLTSASVRNRRDLAVPHGVVEARQSTPTRPPVQVFIQYLR